MAKPKATHYGECQACGSRQKLPGGVLSLHGYTIEGKGHGGYFTGTCPGSGYQPFEKATDLIQEFIRGHEKRRDWLRSRAVELRQPTTDETKVWLHRYITGGWGHRAYYRWDEVAVTMETKKYDDYEIHNFYFEDPDKKDTRIEFRDTYNYGYPKSVAELAKNANEKFAVNLEGDADKCQRYIDWQTNRVNTWIEQPLTAID
jgi:hypothetical protein